jgi:hypothetical protein
MLPTSYIPSFGLHLLYWSLCGLWKGTKTCRILPICLLFWSIFYLPPVAGMRHESCLCLLTNKENEQSYISVGFFNAFYSTLGCVATCRHAWRPPCSTCILSACFCMTQILYTYKFMACNYFRNCDLWIISIKMSENYKLSHGSAYHEVSVRL